MDKNLIRKILSERKDEKEPITKWYEAALKKIAHMEDSFEKASKSLLKMKKDMHDLVMNDKDGSENPEAFSRVMRRVEEVEKILEDKGTDWAVSHPYPKK